MSGILYVVATPIGNLEDLTPRAVRVLRECDRIAAEDTRNTMVLLKHFDIHTPLISNHKFNEGRRSAALIEELLAGKNIALVSDAGTPCISDPGYVLVKAAAEAGIAVVGVCGACAASTAISVSGFFAESFLFFGFVPRERKNLEDMMGRAVSSRTPVLVFYESPMRIQDTMEYFRQAVPEARVCLCNDLSKKFEKIYRGSPGEICDSLGENPAAKKGEYTIVLELNPEIFVQEEAPGLSPEAMLVDTMVKQGISAKEAVKYLSRQEGQKRSALYEASLRLKAMWED